ncbi:MAG: DUF305 domain-containing protein [Actinomycetales bacterium]
MGLLALSACGSHEAASPAPAGSSGATADDVMFAQMMIPHHQQAVVMADLAQTRAASPLVIELAAQIKAAQQPEIDQMTAWLDEWQAPTLSANEAMSAHGGHGMAGMLTDEELQGLEQASGSSFDRLFAEAMIKHHEGAIAMAEPVVDSGDSRVAALAQAIIATQQQEIAKLEAFLNGSN